MIIWSFDHLIIWSYDHMIIWWYRRMTISSKFRSRYTWPSITKNGYFLKTSQVPSTTFCSRWGPHLPQTGEGSRLRFVGLDQHFLGICVWMLAFVCTLTSVQKSLAPKIWKRRLLDEFANPLGKKPERERPPCGGWSNFIEQASFPDFFCMTSPKKMMPYKKVALRAQRVFRTRPSIPRGQPGVFGVENFLISRPNTVSNPDRSRKRPFFHMQEVIYILSSRPLFNPGANLRIVPILTKLEQNWSTWPEPNATRQTERSKCQTSRAHSKNSRVLLPATNKAYSESVQPQFHKLKRSYPCSCQDVSDAEQIPKKNQNHNFAPVWLRQVRY